MMAVAVSLMALHTHTHTYSLVNNKIDILKANKLI